MAELTARRDQVVARPPQDAAPARSGRQGRLDVLRALVVLGLIPIHAARIFDDLGLDNYVRNATSSDAFTWLVAWAILWGMPLLFMVAGMSARHALAYRTPGAFVRERVRRLVVPFVFGTLALVPVIKYLQVVGDPSYQGSYQGSFWGFWPRFLADARPVVDFPWFLDNGGSDFFEISYLYFLWFLFAYSMLLLPVFVRLLRGAFSGALGSAAAWLARPGALLLPAVPLAALEAWLGSEDTGGWNRLVYLVLVLYGFLVALEPGFAAALRRRRADALVLATALTLLLGIWAGALGAAGADVFTGGGQSAAWRALKAVTCWSWLVAFTGSAAAAADRPVVRARTGLWLERLGGWAREAVLPVYVLHMPVLLVIGAAVVRWDASVLVKYLAIVAAAYAVTIGLYELLVRRSRLTRFLFGMKPAPPG